MKKSKLKITVQIIIIYICVTMTLNIFDVIPNSELLYYYAPFCIPFFLFLIYIPLMLLIAFIHSLKND